MSAPSFTYSGNVYTAGTAGTVDFALTSTTGNSIPYLEPGHIHVYKSSNQGTSWTELTRPAQWDFVTSGTVARLVTGIAAGEWVKVQRITPSSAAYVTFQASSLLTADQLNDDTLFNTYLNQERVDQGDQATTIAASAVTTATSAVATANAATVTANSATTTANAATATANSASSSALSAVSTANTASSNASAAVSTANTASSNATTAVNTANNALSAANTAQSTANTAGANASAALNAIAGTVQYVLIGNVAAIPSSPANGYAVEIADSTGIESFSPLTNRPAGFIGSTGLSVRIQYLSSGSTWNWLNYFPNNAETRYLKFSGGTITGNLEIGNTGSLTFEGSTANAFETTLDVVDPTADRTITLPNVTGTVVTTGDTGTVTSTMIADGTIVNADINASAAIAGTKISPDFGSQTVQTTGIISHALGTAAAPTVTFTGDTNTGIYSPGADQLALATNGTGRLFVDSSGNVGIGTAPSAPFHVNGNARVGTADASDCGIEIGAGATGNRAVFIDLTGDTTYTDFGLRIRRGNDGANAGSFLNHRGTGELKLNVIDAGSITCATNSQERLRITSDGKVGVGTSSPVNTLDVNGGIGVVYASGLRAYRDAYSVNNIIIRHQYVSPDDQLQLAPIGDSPTSAIAFRTASSSTLSTRMVIDSSGRVGIGTTSPSARVHSDWTAGSQYRASNGSGYLDILNDSTNSNLISSGPLFYKVLTGSHIWRYNNDTTEAARIDSSGRLLVGTSSALNVDGESGFQGLQIAGTGSPASASLTRFTNTTAGPGFTLSKSRGTSIGTNTAVIADDFIGSVRFTAADGTSYVQAAQISAQVDGTPGLNDMPGRIVLSVTADGASSPTEALRITNDRVIAYNQPDVTSKSAAATLTIAELKTGIIQYTGAAATLTLPTGTLSEGGFSGIYTNMTFEWSVINTGSGTCTIGAGTGHTIVGAATVTAGASGRFASRRTAANTFVTYRLS